MDLRGMIEGVRAHSYASGKGKDQTAQSHLNEVRRELRELIPVGLKVRVSGSGRTLPIVPWVAVLDPNVTSTAQEGLYAVYLYHRDPGTVYLSMNQGATEHLRQAELKWPKVAAPNMRRWRNFKRRVSCCVVG
jgi:hypothetical protein